jgi:branched-chain amino acid transport system substrate-binding protein
MAVGAYDGMRVIYEAAKASKGARGEALLNAMKGQVFESPRGPMYIDAQTRDVVHNVYVRRVERVGGQLWNREIETATDVKDIGKSR